MPKVKARSDVLKLAPELIFKIPLIVIGVVFIGPLINPVKNIWVIHFGLIACAMVIPFALICGYIREIPFLWRLVDCSFGVFGSIPLLLVLKYITKLKNNLSYQNKF